MENHIMFLSMTHNLLTNYLVQRKEQWEFFRKKSVLPTVEFPEGSSTIITQGYKYLDSFCLNRGLKNTVEEYLTMI